MSFCSRLPLNMSCSLSVHAHTLQVPCCFEFVMVLSFLGTACVTVIRSVYSFFSVSSTLLKFWAAPSNAHDLLFQTFQRQTIQRRWRHVIPNPPACRAQGNITSPHLSNPLKTPLRSSQKKHIWQVITPLVARRTSSLFCKMCHSRFAKRWRRMRYGLFCRFWVLVGLYQWFSHFS